MATMAQSRVPVLQNAAVNNAALVSLPQQTMAEFEVPTPLMEYPEQHPAWETLSALPILLDVSVPVKNFRVRDLLALEVKTVIQSSWQGSADIPLCSDGVQLCWTEFETVGQKIAVRLTVLG